MRQADDHMTGRVARTSASARRHAALKTGLLGLAMLGLSACFEESEMAGTAAGTTGNLVALAAGASQDRLQAELDATNRADIAALRYGPAANGLAHAAVANLGNPQAVRQVVQAGADANLVDANGRTPLHFAIEAQANTAIEILLAVGADPDIQTGSGQSPRAFCEDALKSLPDYAPCRTLLRNSR